ncbi:hypothetical protein NA57DRAFT_76177 [Rhizodiscina lignyota]|uniref:DUF7730 domain-containing protein n=1 Tax=Rhizodiscina lignyota TaxID=1504668 RepID=A0A9P4IGU4_9PEZI|nr:hypothetical protein NA57DRAFT_76177 [Rhizodiscina lignyota]
MAPNVLVASRHSQTTKTKGNTILIIRSTVKPPPPRKVKHTLLTIPGELRNHIYTYVFASSVYVELVPASATHIIPLHKTPFNRHATTPVLRTSRPLGKSTPVHRARTTWATSLGALSLVNRQLHRETLAYLYAQPTFYVQSPNRLVNFLSVAPADKLKYVQRLHISYQTYGEPAVAQHRAWKTKSVEKWAGAMAMAAERLPGLRELKVALDIRDTPFKLRLSEPWARPVLSMTKNDGVLPALADVRVGLVSKYTRARYGEDTVRSLLLQGVRLVTAQMTARQKVAQYDGLHRLFAGAMRRRMMGWDLECSLEEYERGIGEGGFYEDVDAPFVVR